MIRVSPWWVAAILVVPCVFYLALTAGTVYFLPGEWLAVEPGMSREDVQRAIPGLITEYQFDPAEEDLDVITGRKIGLRNWSMVISYEDGRVKKCMRFSTDPHSRWMNRIWLTGGSVTFP